MSDTFITIIAILVAGILLFIFPIMAVAERHNDIAQGVAEKAVTDFVSDVATSGSITLDAYNQLNNKLESTGNSYKVDMEVKVLDENVGKKSQWLEGSVVGENTKYSVFTSSIVPELQSKGVYNLKAGDTFSAKVTNESKTLSQNVRSLLTPAGADNAQISAQDSSLVTATGNR